MNDATAESKEVCGDRMKSGASESVRDKGSVTRPNIAVMVGRAFRNIVIVRREDRTVRVDLRSDDVQTAVVE